MNAIAKDIESAAPPSPPAPPPPANELTQDVEHAVRVAADGDIEAALCERTIAALARLAVEQPPAHARLRRALMRADPAITAPLVDGMVSRRAGEADTTRDGVDDEARSGAVEQLVELVQGLGDLFTAPDGTAYVRLHEAPRAVHALGSRSFRESVAHAYYRETGRASKAAQLADAITTLAGIALHDGDARAVHLRAAVDPAGGYLVDLCDDGWRVVRCTSVGWQVLDESPVAFRRTAGMKALPEPARDGTREDLEALFNIEPEDAVLLVAALAEAFRPDTPEPIVEFCGEQGSGKTRTASNFRALVDPHEAPLRAPPRSIPDVYVGAQNNRVLAYDNVSSLSAEMQDAACVISTGGASAQRTLYTDADETTINVKRPVLLTSIATPFTRPDALSRVLRFECPALRRGTRLSDAELVADLARRAPKALGYLLDTFCRALALLPAIELTEAPRLLDFTRLGEALAQADGEAPGTFTARYVESLRATATQSLEAEPLVATLTGLLEERGRIALTEVESLRGDLACYASRAGSAAPPSSARGLGSLLSRYGPALLLTGVRVGYGPRSSRGRRVFVERVQTDFSLPTTEVGDRTTCTTYTTCTDEAESARRARRARSAGPNDMPDEQHIEHGETSTPVTPDGAEVL